MGFKRFKVYLFGINILKFSNFYGHMLDWLVNMYLNSYSKDLGHDIKILFAIVIRSKVLRYKALSIENVFGVFWKLS